MKRSIKSHSWITDRVSGVFSLRGLENYSSNTNCIFHLEPFLPLRLFSWKASRRRNSPIFKPSKTCFPYAFSNHVSKIKQILLRFMYLFSCFSTSSYEALDGSFYTPLGKHPSQMQERSSTLYIFMLSQVIIPTNFLPGLSKCLLAFSPWDTLLTILQGHTISLRAFQTSLKAPTTPHRVSFCFSFKASATGSGPLLQQTLTPRCHTGRWCSLLHTHCSNPWCLKQQLLDSSLGCRDPGIEARLGS